MEGRLVMGSNSQEKQLFVNDKWCKGCGICVEYCPKRILEVKRGKVVIAKPDECIKCGLCEERCPDYAIFLRGKHNE
jgi:2-oxoglutarate ferredoxin oxidoreductase subunit delta